MIPFNKPYMTGKEMHYIYDAVYSGKISGNGKYTEKCQDFLQQKYAFGKCLLTTSCTDALEMAAILLDIKEGDEVIMPAFTFVSTANAFVLRGAKIIFCDSREDHPGIDEEQISSLITPKTKAIVVVHYAGVACDMDLIMSIAEKHSLFVVEDAAQAIDSFYFSKKTNSKQALGSIGHLAAFSFHETKNIISGEGGMLVINDVQFEKRAEIIWEKGTNRSSFYRGEVDKYGWVDIGSSFLPSDIIAAFLWAQLENIEDIQHKRISHWHYYKNGLNDLFDRELIEKPFIPNFGFNNGHMFYFNCKSIKERDQLLKYLKENNIWAVFHYLSLENSPYFSTYHDGRSLPNSQRFSETLVRLPFFYELEKYQLDAIIQVLLNFYL
jgi:dTDP-4-amino-4,6-dideoxygalactose transaminase